MFGKSLTLATLSAFRLPVFPVIDIKPVLTELLRTELPD
jgi:hypothetical protein